MVVLTQRITPMRVVDKQGSEKELFEVKIPEK